MNLMGRVMPDREAEVFRRVTDARGNRVVFLSHCLLDGNVRYPGGAFHPGAVPEVHGLLDDGIGIYQMPCPEMQAWGGVHKRLMLRAYGVRHTWLYPLTPILLRAFVSHTRLRYRLLARSVSREIKRYSDAGVTIVGIVGIGASPSCGVCTTLDLTRSFGVMAACPLARLDRTVMNEHAVVSCRVAGEGLFVRALRRRLKKLEIDVPFLEHDLVTEMRGIAQPMHFEPSL